MSEFIRFILIFGVVFDTIFALAWQLARRKVDRESFLPYAQMSAGLDWL